jgi:integrase
MKLTQSMVNSLTLPFGKADVIFFDDDVPGLGLRLRAGGKRSWIFQYQLGRKQRRMTLGTAPALALTAARKTASELHARVRLGEDPAATKREGQRRAADTVEATLRIYLPEKKQAVAPNSYTSVERHLLRYAKPLHGLGVTLVSRRDVATLLAALAASSGSPTSNRVRASLSAFFAWCIARGIAEQNPVIGTLIASETPRSRVLPVAELAAVWRVCKGDAYGTIVKLLMLTGCRAGEIGGLRFDEIRDDVIVLPPARVKNKRGHLLPIAAPAQAILAGWQATPQRGEDFVFGNAKPFISWSYGKVCIDARLATAGMQLEPWTVHDLRRSVATGMAELGVAPHIVEAVLNHISGHKAGIAGVYNRATYEKEKKVALAMWADHLLAAVEGRADKIVPLRA